MLLLIRSREKAPTSNILDHAGPDHIMDEMVLRAIAKWPNVPSAYGWLSLDRRGSWAIKGQRIASANLMDFINRNYAGDAKGRWFFQNGPQRVFVSLAYTPFVYRTQPTPAGLAIVAHTGTAATALLGAYLDETGAIVLSTNIGPGVVQDQDLVDLLACLTRADGRPCEDALIEEIIEGRSARGALQLQLAIGSTAVTIIDSAQVPTRFGFDPTPRPAPGEPEC